MYRDCTLHKDPYHYVQNNLSLQNHYLFDTISKQINEISKQTNCSILEILNKIKEQMIKGNEIT